MLTLTLLILKNIVHFQQVNIYQYLDDNNDMLVSISDMRIINEMSIEDIKGFSNTLNQSSVIVIDTNIPSRVIEYIVRMNIAMHTVIFGYGIYR